MRFTPKCLAVIALSAIATFSQANENRLFEPLVIVDSFQGDVQVVKPGAETGEIVKQFHAYPYGSRFIVPKKSEAKKEAHITPELNISLSSDHKFKLSEFTDLTISQDASDATGLKKVFDLKYGKLKTYISVSTVKTGGAEDAVVEANLNALSIVTPLATAYRLTDRNEVRIVSEGDNYTILFASESGTMEVVGAQYKLNGMRRNAAFEIAGNKNYTHISNLAGEFTASIEKGVDEYEVVKMKLRCMAKIWRSYADLGGKMAVSVMIGASDGKIRSYAFLEGEKVVTDSSTVMAEAAASKEAVEATDDAVLFDDTVSMDDFGTETTDTTTDTSAEDAFGDSGDDAFNFDW